MPIIIIIITIIMMMMIQSCGKENDTSFTEMRLISIKCILL